MKTILVVEDEHTLSDIICEKLTEEGYEAQKAYDGEEAVNYFKSNKTADLMLLDILLPKKDGFTALKEINELGVKVPVIVFSNFLHDEEEAKARELGARDFLVKAAFSTAEVISKIKEVLEKEAGAQPTVSPTA